jgi:hypothetical protein
VSEKSVHGIRNCDNREKFIQRFGKERFERLTETDSYYSKYKEPQIPPGCKWIFGQFMYIWGNCEVDGMSGQRIFTFRTLNDYVECMKVPLTVAEKKLLLRMKHWAEEVIFEFQNPPEKNKK